MTYKASSITTKRLAELLTPSALSSVITTVIAITLSVGAIIINRYNASSLKVEYLYYQTHHSNSFNGIGGSLVQNSLVKDLPLLFFWALVGAMVYLIAIDIVKAFSSAIELRKELDYVNVHRRTLINNLTIHLAIRIVVILVWLPYLLVFFHHVLPYCLKLAITATSAAHLWSVVGDVLLSVTIGFLAIHLNLILLRLLVLKPRLFTTILD